MDSVTPYSLQNPDAYLEENEKIASLAQVVEQVQQRR